MPNYHFHAKRAAESLVLSETHRLPGHVAKYLTNFQLDGVRFLYNHFKNNQSCILNDESGLGKTAVVCAFLDAVLPHDSSRKCLIIVRNDERIRNWKFHLDVLTTLSTRIVFKREDVDREILYLTKWDCLQKSNSLADYDFDCIIVDNRGELMANKICSGYLLKNYERRISLIVSSSDVAVDLKQFHTMLRLCSRLDKNYADFKVFEDKFSLPDDVNMLESYFLRREKIINFCRDFRLRRYRHQYEDDIPLTQPEAYLNSLKIWAENPIYKNSSSSSSSVRILTSSSEKDAEQLLKSLFNAKDENDLNAEVSAITTEVEKRSRVQNNCDYEDMPPLFLESDSDDKALEATKKPVIEHFVPIFVETHAAGKKVPAKRPRVEEEHSMRITRSAAKIVEKTSNLNSKAPKKEFQGSKVKKKDMSISTPARNLRSHLATRSKTLKSKYLVIDLTENDGKMRTVKKRKSKTRTRKKPADVNKDSLTVPKDEVQSNAPKTNQYSTRSRTGKISTKTTDNSEGDKSNRKKLENKSDKVAKDCSTLLRTKGADENETKKKVRTTKIAENKEQSTSERRNSGDVHFVSPQDPIIVLSGSTDDCTPSTLGGGFKQVRPSKKLVPSPDIFGNVIDECDITCSQRSRLSDSLKGYGILCTGGIKTNRHRSCLDILEQEYRKEKQNAIKDAGEIFEMSTNELLKTSRLNGDPLESGPLRSRSVTYQKNKITKYLIGTDTTTTTTTTLSLESNQPIEISDTQKNYDLCPKTPARQNIVQRCATTSRKSPKVTNGRDMTPNSLTKWLIKSDSASRIVSRPLKRRRLDLWFND